jgi:hypothetical protein
MPERDPSLHQTCACEGLVSFGMTGWFYIWVEEGAAGRRRESHYVRMQESAACRPFLLSFPENLCHAERKRGISLYDAETEKKCCHYLQS